MNLENGISVSHEWIYNHVIRDARDGGELFKSMRKQHRKRKRRLPKSEDRRGQIKNRIGIENRPEIVESRERVGDWEVDTVVSRESKTVLVTAVERKSLLTRIILAPTRESTIVTKALVRGLKRYKKYVYTITGDNGKEFADHEEVAEVLEACFYFATPYHSWERGTNENTNGLIRQYFPKKTDFSKLTAEDVASVEWKINNRPRKSLGYKTASEVFKEQTGFALPAEKASGNTPRNLYSRRKLALAA
jgi:IS30 family transposase